MAEARVTKDITTGVGILSFPRVFPSTKGKNDKGEDVYDIQIIIPKTSREDLKAILAAIKEVGEAKWGDNWRSVRLPLRDGDKEKNELTEDGQTTKGEKYPERLGAYFINARSSQPVGVYDRQRAVITDPGVLYGGCKGKLALSFYPYNKAGNQGIGAGLNGVQFIADGDPLSGGKPPVESMFDILEGDEGLDDDLLGDEVEETPKPAKKAAKKAPTKKAAKKAAPVEDELDELSVDDSDDDLFEDLDA